MARSIYQPFFLQVVGRAQDPVDSSQVWTFNALQISAFVLNVVVFSTAFLSSRVRRAPLWFMFMGGWILWAVGFGLLFLAGRQFDDEPPPQALCLFQAGLVYAFPPAMEFLNVGLLAQVYLVFRATIANRRPRTQTPLLAVLIPMAIFTVIMLDVLVIGLKRPDVIAKTSAPMYCSMTDQISFSFKLSAALFALGVVSLLTMEVVLGFMLYRHWDKFQLIRHAGSGAMIFRIFIFSVGPALALVMKVVAAKAGSRDVDFLAMVMVHSSPALAAIIFGTHRDIIRSWYWERDCRTSPAQLTVPTVVIRKEVITNDGEKTQA